MVAETGNNKHSQIDKYGYNLMMGRQDLAICMDVQSITR